MIEKAPTGNDKSDVIDNNSRHAHVRDSKMQKLAEQLTGETFVDPVQVAMESIKEGDPTDVEQTDYKERRKPVSIFSTKMPQVPNIRIPAKTIDERKREAEASTPKDGEIEQTISEIRGFKVDKGADPVEDNELPSNSGKVIGSLEQNRVIRKKYLQGKISPESAERDFRKLREIQENERRDNVIPLQTKIPNPNHFVKKGTSETDRTYLYDEFASIEGFKKMVEATLASESEEDKLLTVMDILVSIQATTLIGGNDAKIKRLSKLLNLLLNNKKTIEGNLLSDILVRLSYKEMMRKVIDEPSDNTIVPEQANVAEQDITTKEPSSRERLVSFDDIFAAVKEVENIGTERASKSARALMEKALQKLKIRNTLKTTSKFLLAASLSAVQIATYSTAAGLIATGFGGIVLGTAVGLFSGIGLTARSISKMGNKVIKRKK